MLKNKHPNFCDGVIEIFEQVNSAPKGFKPQITLKFKLRLRYKERTIGYGRYYTAMQENFRVDLLLRTPRTKMVSANDIAVLPNGERYKIIQMQYPEDINPPVMDLTLERLGANDGL